MPLPLSLSGVLVFSIHGGGTFELLQETARPCFILGMLPFCLPEHFTGPRISLQKFSDCGRPSFIGNEISNRLQEADLGRIDERVLDR